ncbi:MAG: hypothetical protein GC204_12055 [Chloroflexi bacterium]|nr:hypothetical protein [Chloroflexota bacterium]
MWNDLLTTGLIGTERRALDLENLPESFRELVAQLEGQDSERILLSLAGAATLQRRVGQTAPLDATPLLDPCDLNDLPPCSPRAGLLLQQILNLSQYAPLLPEWIALAARRGQRVSEEYLPRFLTALNRPAPPEHFYNIIGKRGRWLAQQNEGWSYAVLPQNDTEWETASFPARLEYLRRLRASHPNHARALVESVWKSEKADNRSALIQTFEVSLTLEDEPFLEAMLDDRAGKVGLYAASVLKNLAASAYRQRIITRGQQFIHIHWQKQLLSRKLAIEITLPETCDESMIRDGIDQKPSTDSELGTRAYWLFSIATRLPSSFWLSDDWSAPDLVQAISESDDSIKTYLHTALANVSGREHHDLLALALLENAEVAEGVKAQVLQAISPQLCENFLMRALDSERSSSSGKSIFEVTNLCKFGYTWSSPLTRSFLATLKQTLKARKRPHLSDAITAHLSAYVTFFSPTCVEELRELANIETSRQSLWIKVVKQAVSTLEFRRNMDKEFA